MMQCHKLVNRSGNSARSCYFYLVKKLFFRIKFIAVFFFKNYYKNSPDPDRNPRGPADGKENVLRGGSWKSTADASRSAYRLGENPGFSDACLARDAIGFRCARKPS